ncbi:hypothetical protein GDO78_012268 [Eleutherodactylus coqui]|uniref:Uncharacterized protein n=1 Tax=Eleutherodactylus coqui TaxID=57060 RepID=A0A8J6F2D5_ELECQ|nr:hypothetical protein GDO78_012268 [Eleutherodactylus coqui]
MYLKDFYNAKQKADRRNTQPCFITCSHDPYKHIEAFTEEPPWADASGAGRSLLPPTTSCSHTWAPNTVNVSDGPYYSPSITFDVNECQKADIVGVKLCSRPC